jgi:hypothetical protein
MVPVGAIVAWDKSFPSVPSLPPNFVECNGQTVSDASSPLNGQTLRNLNGSNQFLRGNTTSGGTGGSASHVHLYAGSTDIEDGDTDVQSKPALPPWSPPSATSTHIPARPTLPARCRPTLRWSG